MAAKKKNTQQEQLYKYSPQYGFIPADSANANENTAFTQNPYGQNFNEMPFFGQFPPHYGQFHPHYGANPMHQQHMMQLNAMQAQIMQMQQNMQNPQANDLSFEKAQELYALINDISQGKAQPEKLLPFMQNVSSEFWKGLALGVGAVLVYNYTPLKDMLSSLLGNFTQTSPHSQDDNLDEDGFEKEE